MLPKPGRPNSATDGFRLKLAVAARRKTTSDVNRVRPFLMLPVVPPAAMAKLSGSREVRRLNPLMLLLRHREAEMRSVLRIGLLVCGLLCPTQAGAEERNVDVLVYSATPGGIAAALAAGSAGRTVLLVEPTARIGGLTTSGLSHSDFHSFESLTGTFLEFSRRVEQHYRETYGDDSSQVEDSFRGTHGEPKVNLAVFEAMLAEQPTVSILKQHQLQKVSTTPSDARRRITAVELTDAEGASITVRSRIVIDGSYEGDLMALAGVEWRAGREARSEYGESLAPEEADDQLQAYNFRFIMTRDPENRVSPKAPVGYRREDFLPVLEVLNSGVIEKVFDYPRGCIFKAHEPALPNGKHDINDVSRGPIRLSLPGINRDWPDGDAETRAAIFAEQLRDQAGLLYFLQNDEAVPEKFRSEAREWGWCRDEFSETDHLPPQLYIREARRMVGVHVFVQADSEYVRGDVRAVRHADAIAMADYGNNCHGTAHEGPRFGGKHTGEFYNAVPPYQIPYGVLLPGDVDNLLVPVAASSSHVGFCALRLEPVWTSLGQAAGHAAALALEQQTPCHDVDIMSLQRRLHEDGSATIYVSDVLPGNEDFAIVQWWGTAGGLHGLYPHVNNPKPRGSRIISQYSTASPHHEAALNEPLSEDLHQRWRQLAVDLGIAAERLPSPGEGTTRREFVRAAWRLWIADER
jgi:hypothetical protein